MRPHSKSLFTANQSMTYADSASIYVPPDLNQSSTNGASALQIQISLHKSKSNISLMDKEKTSTSFVDHNTHQKTHQNNQKVPGQGIKTLADPKPDLKSAKSLNTSPRRTPTVAQDAAVVKKDVKPKQATRYSMSGSESRQKATRVAVGSYSEKKSTGVSQSVLDIEKVSEKKQPLAANDIKSRENSPLKKNSARGHTRKPASYDESSLKSILKKNVDESKEKSPVKNADKQISFEGDDSPVFFFNIPTKPVIKTTSTQGSGTLKDKIKQKILDLVDPNDFKITALPSGKQRGGAFDDKKRVPVYAPTEPKLLNIVPVQAETTDFQKQLDEMKASIANVLGESKGTVPSSSPNISYMTYSIEKDGQEPSRMRTNSWNNIMKQNNNYATNTTKSTVVNKRTSDDSIDETNGQRSRSDFSFKMTYFKPIDDSTLDEFIQGANVSRTMTKTPVTSDAYASFSPTRRRTNTDLTSKKSSNNILNQSQEGNISVSRDVSNGRQRKTEQKPVDTSPKKWDFRTTSSMKQRNTTVNSNVNTSFKLESVFRSSNSKKPEPERPKSALKRQATQIVQSNPGDQKVVNTRDGFQRHHRKSVSTIGGGSQDDSKLQKPGLKTSNTYSKLDKLLQELKHNNSSIILKEEPEAGLDAGLFAGDQVLYQHQEASVVDSIVNQSFRNTFNLDNKRDSI